MSHEQRAKIKFPNFPSVQVAALDVFVAMAFGVGAGAALATTFNWNNAAGGGFSTATNWTPAGGPPDSAFDTAVFDILAVYEVNIGDVVNSNFEVKTGGVTFDLFRPRMNPIPAQAFTYSLAGTLGPAANISSHPGALFPVTLTITGGRESGIGGDRSTVDANGFLHIGRDANSNGSLELQDVFWDSTGTTTVGLNGVGDLLINSGSAMTNSAALVGFGSGSVGNVSVEGFWSIEGTLSVGVLGNGTMTIDASASVITDSGSGIAVQAGSTSSVTVNTVDQHRIGLPRRRGLDGGTVNAPTLHVRGTVNATGTLDVSGGGSITALVLDGGTVTANRIDFGSNSLSGFGTLNGDVAIGGDVTATGDLTLGDATSFSGVVIGGNLNVGTQHVTINKKGFFSVGTSTILTGGLLSVSDGAAIPVGAGLVARGTIDGRIVQQAGSTIEATNDLILGDATSTAGFFSDGEMLVANKQRITLLDANEAVLGSLTTLGGAGLTGNVAAPNGAVLEFGKNIVGFGAVETPDDPTKPLINNGSIAGNSVAEPITITGYMKGVGTCDNCDITGTDSPGFSTAAVNRGSVSYNGTRRRSQLHASARLVGFVRSLHDPSDGQCVVARCGRVPVTACGRDEAVEKIQARGAAVSLGVVGVDRHVLERALRRRVPGGVFALHAQAPRFLRRLPSDAVGASDRKERVVSSA